MPWPTPATTARIASFFARRTEDPEKTKSRKAFGALRDFEKQTIGGGGGS